MLIVIVVILSAAGSVLPFSPLEPFLIGLSAVARSQWLVPLALLAAAAHMVGKIALYFGSERVMRFMPTASEATAHRARAQLERRPWLRSVSLFVSAFLGVPSFYAVTVLAGSLKVPLREFAAIGFVGRSARFIALVAMPQIIISLF